MPSETISEKVGPQEGFMRTRLILCAVIAAMLLPLPAMAGDKDLWGTALGAGVGGYLGSMIGKGDGRLAATGAGVFLGGALGNSIGSSLDRADSSYAGSGGSFYSPSYPAFQSYEPNYVAPPAPPSPRIIYVEPEVIEYRRAPTPVYVEEGYLGPPPAERRTEHKRHCREFTQTIKIDGRTHESYGTACLRPDGTWQIER